MTAHYDVVCLGGGVTGLAVGWNRDLPIFEARNAPGGICASYYLRSAASEPMMKRPTDGSGFRFEIGGGHWIFGQDKRATSLLRRLAPMKSYQRRASVCLDGDAPLIPYPLQFHLSCLEKQEAHKVLSEIEAGVESDAATMADWVRKRFGETLTAIFFGPFHELYTAGLWRSIAPRDGYKSPLDIDQVREGVLGAKQTAGYNVSFLYPIQGLDTLCRKIAAKCDIRFDHEVVDIDLKERVVSFSNDHRVHYNRLISTLPLVRMSQLTGLESAEAPDPYTAVLVLNIGAARGSRLPDDHWIYFPTSDSGFHRVGIYSNVDHDFLPRRFRSGNSHCALYVERSFLEEDRPGDAELHDYSQAVIKELQQIQFIGDVEVCHPTWIPVAYTWNLPGSDWAKTMRGALLKHGVVMAGRYGRWKFQGITESIAEGLQLGSDLSRE